MQVERHDYTTEDGDERTLVFASPRLNERTYQRFVSQAEGVWTASVASMLLITFVAIAAVFRTLQRSMRPLEDAMRARRSGRDHMPEAQSLPIELRGTYRSFTELMDALEETREENQTLIADVSHDLKTPLTVIGGYAKAFADGCVPEDRRDAYLHAIYEKSLAASQLLDELQAGFPRETHALPAAARLVGHGFDARSHPGPDSLIDQESGIQPLCHIGDLLERADIVEKDKALLNGLQCQDCLKQVFYRLCSDLIIHACMSPLPESQLHAAFIF